MDSDTFRSRLVSLMQKSRKAIRLYSTMGSLQQEANSEFRDMQIDEWKAVNTELLRQLTIALDNPQSKLLGSSVSAIRDHFYSKWRMTESELHVRQKELLQSSESGDFIKAAVLASELVSLKARVQAAQAAHHELEEVIDRSRVSVPAVELDGSQIVNDRASMPPTLAKVIPLRKQL